MSLRSQIESLLFVSSRPLSTKRLAEVTGQKRDEVAKALEEIEKDYAARTDAGVMVLRNGDEVQIATSPENTELVKNYLKDETFGEMTRPALETLTIIAYRGPIAKAELEQIRGVNCSLILRNLMIRGLVEVKEESREGGPTSIYGVTFDFIRYLGLRQVSELPDYENLRSEENLKKLLEASANAAAKPADELAQPAGPVAATEAARVARLSAADGQGREGSPVGEASVAAAGPDGEVH